MRGPSVRRALPAVLTAIAMGASVLPVVLAAPASGVPVATAVVRTSEPLTIQVLSNRADLISGGDALIRFDAPRSVARKHLTVTVDGRDVTKGFARRASGAFEGLVTGLRNGTNLLRARAVVSTYKAGKLTKVVTYTGKARITNHPNGGPIFSGPQWVDYTCQAGAVDEQCNQPAKYTWLYKSSDLLKDGLHPYNPKFPPTDVATTTTDEGVEVPFIVRREDGFQNRDRYTIMTLFQPGQSWQAWAPQEQWNHKVLATHGGGCGAGYAPASPPLNDYSGTIPVDELPTTAGLLEMSYLKALGKGFAVISAALNNTGHNCNVAVEAEAMMMLKERLVERYGTIRYTIGTGCSGGSIAQHTIANSYPGIYQGLITTCSYPDVFTAGAQFADYHLLRKYFEDPARWGTGVLWLPTQMAAVEGHLTHLNAIVADEGLFKGAINPETDCSGVPAPVAGDRTTRFDSETNPGGVRCDILTINRSILGLRPKASWSDTEKAAGTGFAGLPFANVGVQYGLKQLRDGVITGAQFVDLNRKLGGLDINGDHVADRIRETPGAVRHAYRSGLINEANHLDEVAMINHAGPDPGLAHDYAHTWWMQERLKRDQGHTGNRVLWFGATPLIGDLTWANDAVVKMDAWLAAVERDTRDKPLAEKIVEDRPASVKDRCLLGSALKVLCDQDLVQTALTRLSTPREQAGDDIANDRVACQLRAIDPADYKGLSGLPMLNAAQLAELAEIFPKGVCDYSRPGVGQASAQTWLTYQTAAGDVIYGGRNLAAPPANSGAGWMAAPFRELWTK